MEKILVKIGGRAASDIKLMDDLIEETAALKDRYSFVFVHGGGAEVTRVSEVFGLKAEFRDGIRITKPEEMDIVDMVLAGSMNKLIVRKMRSCGINAAGISGCDGGILSGEALSPETRTGKIKAANPALLELLSGGGFLPVLAPVSSAPDGTALNINADEAGFETAAAIKADRLVFISDIPGVLGADGGLLSTLSAEEAGGLIEAGVINGGMVPKIRSSAEALGRGVGGVVIGGYACRGDLEKLIKGMAGTMIKKD